MSAPRLSRRAVAALFLARQRLDRPRGRRLGARALRDFAEATCGVQIDSVNVVDRAHHLSLWSRFGPYDRRRLEKLLYRERVLFEYLSHVACFVATSDLPIWKSMMQALPERWRQRWGDDPPATLCDQVEAEIAAHGTRGNADFERPGGGRAGGWWSWKPAQHALDYLWKCGRIAVHSRENFQKRYAVMDRVLPAWRDTEAVPYASLPRVRVLRSLAAMGAATRADLAGYWTWPRLPAATIGGALRDLVDTGEVVELRADFDDAPYYARAEDLPALARAARVRRPSRGTTLLSPFDSLLWHRDRVERLWGFRYRIEIYVPGHQRTHGYYTLPLLHEGMFVGRVDLKTHRDAGVLEARHVHLEPWLGRAADPPGVCWGAPPDTAGVLAGLADALHSLARFVGAEQVRVGRVTPAAAKPALARALRAAGSGSAR